MRITNALSFWGLHTVILRLAEESALLGSRLDWCKLNKDPFAALRMTGGSAYNQNYTVILRLAEESACLGRGLIGASLTKIHSLHSRWQKEIGWHRKSAYNKRTVILSLAHCHSEACQRICFGLDRGLIGASLTKIHSLRSGWQARRAQVALQWNRGFASVKFAKASEILQTQREIFAKAKVINNKHKIVRVGP